MSSSVKSVHFQVQIIRGLLLIIVPLTVFCFWTISQSIPLHPQSTHARIAPSNSRFILSVSPPTKAHPTSTTHRDIISSWVEDGRTSSSNLIFTFIQPPTTYFICLFFQFIMHQFRASLKVPCVTCGRIAWGWFTRLLLQTEYRWAHVSLSTPHNPSFPIRMGNEMRRRNIKQRHYSDFMVLSWGWHCMPWQMKTKYHWWSI